MEKLLEVLRAKAIQTANFDDEEFFVDDWAGGNIDDAYTLGSSDGEIAFARQLIEILEN
jgi:hypothetical protein